MAYELKTFKVNNMYWSYEKKPTSIFIFCPAYFCIVSPFPPTILFPEMLEAKSFAVV